MGPGKPADWGRDGDHDGECSVWVQRRRKNKVRRLAERRGSVVRVVRWGSAAWDGFLDRDELRTRMVKDRAVA